MVTLGDHAGAVDVWDSDQDDFRRRRAVEASSYET